MRTILLPVLASLATITSVFAITDADITPAALLGKTLTFTIADGTAPLATTGTWTGTFATTGNGFTAAKVTGDFVNISTTYAVTAQFTGETDGTFDQFVSGVSDKAYFGLTVQGGIGHFDLGLGSGIMEGTFTIGGSPVVKVAEIDVKNAQGKSLTDGKSKINLGIVKKGKASVAVAVTIKNTGKADLKGLAINQNGANKGEFTTSALSKSKLGPGESTTFHITFKPKSSGVKNAAIHILSNDSNESPFDIKLTGTGQK